jgi:hypothetical protein
MTKKRRITISVGAVGVVVRVVVMCLKLALYYHVDLNIPKNLQLTLFMPDMRPDTITLNCGTPLMNVSKRTSLRRRSALIAEPSEFPRKQTLNRTMRKSWWAIKASVTLGGIVLGLQGKPYEAVEDPVFFVSEIVLRSESI